MPTVLRVGKFRVFMYHPLREHEPPHVHVFNSDGEVVIELTAHGRAQRIRNIGGIRPSDLANASWLVAEHNEYLLTNWRKLHD